MYILHCADDSFYVGSCWDLAVRVDQHINGFGCAYTSKRKPVELVYAEDFERRDEAWVREKQIQGWSHAKRLALIEDRLDDLKKLSRSRASQRAEERRTGVPANRGLDNAEASPAATRPEVRPHRNVPIADPRGREGL